MYSARGWKRSAVGSLDTKHMPNALVIVLVHHQTPKSNQIQYYLLQHKCVKRSSGKDLVLVLSDNSVPTREFLRKGKNGGLQNTSSGVFALGRGCSNSAVHWGPLTRNFAISLRGNGAPSRMGRFVCSDLVSYHPMYIYPRTRPACNMLQL